VISFVFVPRPAPEETLTHEMNAIDFDRLLKLRLVVGRFGEMDLARWWNTQHMLGQPGATVLKRGFRRTHLFVQARVVFAVAKSRCAKIWQPDQCMTLWHLPAEVEDQLEERWHHWLDEIDRWTPFFQEIAELEGNRRPDVIVWDADPLGPHRPLPTVGDSKIPIIAVSSLAHAADVDALNRLGVRCVVPKLDAVELLPVAILKSRV